VWLVTSHTLGPGPASVRQDFPIVCVFSGTLEGLAPERPPCFLQAGWANPDLLGDYARFCSTAPRPLREPKTLGGWIGI